MKGEFPMAMAEHDVNVDNAKRANFATPTEQLSEFLSKTGIDPQRYGDMNLKVEHDKALLDERLQAYRNQTNR